MTKLKVVLFSFLLAIAFGACNTSNSVTEIPIAQPTETAFILPTSTQHFVPTTDLLTPSAIAEFFATQEAITVTPQETETLTYEDCGSAWASWVYGSWTLCNGFENPIAIMNVSGTIWQFSYNSYYGADVKNLCTRLHYITNDETYLYFSLDPDCELIEPGFVVSTSMFRMNLRNGEVVEVLKASYNFETYDGNYYSVSISPTGRRMAYIYPQESPITLNILDLQTGKNRSFPLEEKYTGGGLFLYSESGTKLAFKLESEKDYDRFISIGFLDLLSDNSPVIFIKDKDFLWISSRLEVTDHWVRVIPIEGEALFYDIETGVLSPVFQ